MVHSLSGAESRAGGAKSVCPMSSLNRIGEVALWGTVGVLLNDVIYGCRDHSHK